MDKAIFDEMIATRRHLHTIPEEGWTEFETTYFVAQRLKELGFTDVRLGTQVINPANVLGRYEQTVAKAIERAESHGVPHEFIEKIEGYTGCVAVLNTGRPGPVTAFRFDMDCNPVEETDDPDHVPNRLGFRSTHPGFMHACGHDGHTAVGLAVARWIMEHKDELFTGTPSHAGNNPHKGHSALLAASATAMMIVGIPRHGDGASRVAVGKLVAGEGRNVTPVHAYMQTEVRGETAEINEYLCQKIEHIVKGNSEAYEVEGRIEKVGEATTVIECKDVLDDLKEIAQGIPEVTNVVDLCSPAGSEDFTMMLKRVVERGGVGGMFRWGCNHHGHHRADFDLQDTQSMPIGFKVFTGYAKKVNGI